MQIGQELMPHHGSRKVVIGVFNIMTDIRLRLWRCHNKASHNMSYAWCVEVVWGVLQHQAPAKHPQKDKMCSKACTWLGSIMQPSPEMPINLLHWLREFAGHLRLRPPQPSADFAVSLGFDIRSLLNRNWC